MKTTLIIAFALCLLWVGDIWGANVTTLADLRQDVNNRFLVSTDNIFPDSLLDDFINEACREVAGYDVIHKIDTIVTVANTKYYDLNTDFLKLVTVYDDAITGKRAFDIIPASAIGKIGAMLQESTPGYVWVEEINIPTDTVDHRICFYPVFMDSNLLVVIYAAEAVELSGATDTTNIPYKYRKVVVDLAAGLCQAKGQEFNKAGWWISWHDQVVNKKLMFEQKRYDYIIKPRVIE